MIRNLAQGSTGLGQRKIANQLPDSARHVLRGEKRVAQICHRHDHIIGKPWHIGMVFRVKGNDHANGGKNSSI